MEVFMAGDIMHTVYWLWKKIFMKINQILGQVGDGTSGNNRTSPVLVVGISNVTQIEAGGYHSLVLTGEYFFNLEKKFRN